MVKLAAIDLGTVSSRLLCATMRDGAIVESRKHTVITDLGEGVDDAGSVFCSRYRARDGRMPGVRR